MVPQACIPDRFGIPVPDETISQIPLMNFCRYFSFFTGVILSITSGTMARTPLIRIIVAVWFSYVMHLTKDNAGFTGTTHNIGQVFPGNPESLAVFLKYLLNFN
jgi:hypothetical protein